MEAVVEAVVEAVEVSNLDTIKLLLTIIYQSVDAAI